MEIKLKGATHIEEDVERGKVKKFPIQATNIKAKLGVASDE